jgi:hypothetical protein
MGGTSVYLGDAVNRLIVDPGAEFTGIVEAVAGAANTLELAGTSPGTISGLGTQYIGFQTVAIDSGARWTVGGTEAGFNSATIQGFGPDDTLDVSNLTFNGGDSVTLNGSSDLLTIENSTGGTLETIQLAGSFAGDFFHLNPDSGTGTLITENTVACYCRGTRIRTAEGDIAVENLRIGHYVITVEGDAWPIKWIGRRSYRDWLAVGNAGVQPICFRAGSIADRVPARDLYVSPEHAMFLDGMLIPAQHVVNGVSILKVEEMEEIEYFHLEFDRHVVIFAESAAAESFVDDESRMLFHNADEYRRLYSDEPRGGFTEFCAPRVEDGSALEAVRRRLNSRAARLLPDGIMAEAPLLRGYLDSVTRTGIVGWAFEPDAPDRRVPLVILANGAVIGQVIADRHRPGLAECGIGDGNHAYRFELPQGLAADMRHKIEVRRESDWSSLTDSPRILASGGQNVNS